MDMRRSPPNKKLGPWPEDFYIFIELSENLKLRCATCVSPPSVCEWGKGPYPGVMLLYMQVAPVQASVIHSLIYSVIIAQWKKVSFQQTSQHQCDIVVKTTRTFQEAT